MDTLEGMRTFVAVARCGSFTTAAQKLGRSTALVSKYVGQLEERLQVRLLERTTRSLRLTDIGETYLRRAEELLAQIDELEGSLEQKHAAPSGTLVISAPVTFGEHYVATVVSKFVCQYVGVSVDLRLTDRFVNLIDEGVDLAVRIAELPDSSMIARHLCPARIVYCAAPSYLKRRGHPKIPGDLGEHDCIFDRNFRHPGAWPFQIDGKRTFVKINGRVMVNSAEAARAVALEGAGIALIPSYAIGGDLRTGRLIPLLVEYEALSLNVYAVYPHRQHLAGKTRAIVNMLVEMFSGEPLWERVSEGM